MNTLHGAIGGLRRASLVVAIATATMLCAGTAHARPCSDETLWGTYGLRVSGEVLQGTVTDPTTTIAVIRDGVDLATFDGRGHFTQEDFVLGNGAFLLGLPTDSETGFNDMESGTYTVNPNCTGTFTINEPGPVVIVTMFVLTNGGQTIHAIVSSLTPPGAPGPVPASIHADGERQ
jgi:hypothetical protein